jgi:RNA polymerase sigma-70 factor (ECF subfamily)
MEVFDDQEIEPPQVSFMSTNWGVVSEASGPDSAQARQALAQLCQNYWYPLYAYVRRHGHSPHDAQDLTQAFFQRLLEKNFVSIADRNRGRFRSFLISVFEHFLAKEWRKERAIKRGGGALTIRLKEEDGGEDRYRAEGANNLTPEKLYNRGWAMTLLNRALDVLRHELTDAGKGDLFEELEGCLVGDKPDETYGQIAQRLGMTEAAVKTSVCRLRRRYGEILREQVSQTVTDLAEVESELKYLANALRPT